jgi:undecaprenyl phosphate N,N'-diacetylbacillosamine 1-phosphate transferase
MYKFFFKRIIDLISAIIVFTITSPLFLLTFVVLCFQNKGSIFFYQERPGLHLQPFHIIKFKTMIDKRDVNGNLLPDIERITKFGGLIRKLSIDELPQLINVLKGDMSLIGPRPLLFKYIPLYSKEQLRRHEVRPGITGWAQVNGRNSISWTRKFELDIEYINKISLQLDIYIFWITIVKIIKSEGINQSDVRPMMPFDGKN